MVVLQVHAEVIEFILKSNHIALRRLDPLLDEVKEHQRILEYVCICPEVVDRDRPNRLRANVHSDFSKMLYLRREFRQWIERHGAYRDRTIVLVSKDSDLEVILIVDRHGVRTSQVLHEALALRCWVKKQLLHGADVLGEIRAGRSLRKSTTLHFDHKHVIVVDEHSICLRPVLRAVGLVQRVVDWTKNSRARKNPG